METPTRSPGFPFIDLERAVRRARQLNEAIQERRIHGGPDKSTGEVLQAWGIKTSTSSALPQTIAALHQYGLLVDTDYGILVDVKESVRRIALSELAMRVLAAPPYVPEQEALRTAALKPRVFAELWQELQRERPNLALFLTATRVVGGRAPFTRKGVTQVLRIFRETFEYAGLLTERHRELLEATFDAEARGLDPLHNLCTDDSTNMNLVAFSEPRSRDDWTEEPLTDEDGGLILIRYRGKPSRKRYEFIRDFLDLKIKRLDHDR